MGGLEQGPYRSANFLFLVFGGGLLLMGILYRALAHSRPGKVRRIFRRLLILSAAFMVFSHGSNDGEKLIGVFLWLSCLAVFYRIPGANLGDLTLRCNDGDRHRRRRMAHCSYDGAAPHQA